MAKTRALVKRRKAIQNIRKITRTMELIATARFKKALDRAVEAEAFTRKIAELAADLSANATDLSHPLLERRERRLQRGGLARGGRPAAARSAGGRRGAARSVGQARHRLLPLPGHPRRAHLHAVR